MPSTTSNESQERGRRERNAEATKLRILDAAEAEFVKKGFDGARIRDIAQTAGVHHALLHHYFVDKQGLYRAVVERSFTAVSSRATEILLSVRDPIEIVRRELETLVDFYADNPALMHLMRFASMDPGSPAHATFEEIWDRMIQPLLEAVAEALARGQEEGVFRSDVPPRQLVTVAMGAAAFVFEQSPFFRRFLGADARDPDALAAHKAAVLAFVDQGLRPPKGAT